jgi:hypothetical protein
MLEIVSIVAWIVISVILIFTLGMILVARIEKRVINVFEPIAEPDLPQQSAYMQAMNRAAENDRFCFCGWYGQKQGRIYRAIAAMWLSPDGLTLAVVGGGKIAGIAFKKTYLLSKPIDNAILQTCDDVAESDLSGIQKQDFLLNADFAEMYQFHQERAVLLKIDFEPFDEVSVLKECIEMERKRVEELAKMGLAKFCDWEQRDWRYTTKGAILLFVKGFMNQLGQAAKQSERLVNKARPGEPERKVPVDDGHINVTKALGALWGEKDSLTFWSFTSRLYNLGLGLFLSVVFGVIPIFGLYAIITSWTWHIVNCIFVVILFPLSIYGIFLILYFLRSVLQLFNPQVKMVLQPKKIRLGSHIDLLWKISGNTDSLEKFVIYLECIEEITTKGKQEEKEKVLCRIDISEEGNPNYIPYGKAGFDIPEDVEPSLKSEREKRKVIWQIKVRGNIKGIRPDIEDDFTIFVLPSKPDQKIKENMGKV